MIDPSWVSLLKPLVDQDLNMRNVLLERGVFNDTYHPEMERVHLKNAEELKKLIGQMGFPVLSNAGEEGVRLSWLIIHHSLSLPDFLRSCLLEMRLAAAQKDYPLELLAYTEDRVAFFEGRKQLFGTNFEWKDGDFVPTPIEDAKNVEMRRRSYGLPPLSINSPQNGLERPPKDPEKKAKELAEWLKKVGWLP